MGAGRHAMIVLEPANLLATPGLAAGKPPVLRKRELNRFVALARAAVGVEGEVAILLTDDDGIRRLNRLFRHKDKPTDVLSFPAENLSAARRRGRLGGDLAISAETALRQAEEFGHDLETEIKLLLLHGLLHLAGYDHESDTGEMTRREGVLRRQFGLPSGLIQRSGARASSKRSSSLSGPASLPGPAAPARKKAAKKRSGRGKP